MLKTYRFRTVQKLLRGIWSTKDCSTRQSSRRSQQATCQKTSQHYEDQGRNSKKWITQPFYIAPEVLKGSYDEKCDVWSAGVILYIILCGYPPFYGDTNKQILEEVKKGKLDFSGPEWKTKTPEVFDLLKKMICAPEERFSAQNVLDHVWMSGKQHLVGVDDAKIKSHLEKIVSFSKLPKLTQIILMYLARQLNEMTVFNTQQVFNYLDKNQAGYIEHSILINSNIPD